MARAGLLQRCQRDAGARITNTAAAAVAAAAGMAAAALVPGVVHGGAQHGVLVVLPGVGENDDGAWKAPPLYPLLADKQAKLDAPENLHKTGYEDRRPGTVMVGLQLSESVLSAQQLSEGVLGARQLSEGVLGAQ